jgi:plasmid stabilization system protein ParE
MTVLWAKKAYDDLDGIANYLAGLSDDAAERTIDRIRKVLRQSKIGNRKSHIHWRPFGPF